MEVLFKVSGKTLRRGGSGQGCLLTQINKKILNISKNFDVAISATNIFTDLQLEKIQEKIWLKNIQVFYLVCCVRLCWLKLQLGGIYFSLYIIITHI